MLAAKQTTPGNVDHIVAVFDNYRVTALRINHPGHTKVIFPTHIGEPTSNKLKVRESRPLPFVRPLVKEEMVTLIRKAVNGVSESDDLELVAGGEGEALLNPNLSPALNEVRKTLNARPVPINRVGVRVSSSFSEDSGMYSVAEELVDNELFPVSLTVSLPTANPTFLSYINGEQSDPHAIAMALLMLKVVKNYHINFSVDLIAGLNEDPKDWEDLLEVMSWVKTDNLSITVRPFKIKDHPYFKLPAPWVTNLMAETFSKNYPTSIHHSDHPTSVPYSFVGVVNHL